MRQWGKIGILVVSAVALLTACTETPEAKKSRHLLRGDKYFDRGRYREALIEYNNVLRLDQNQPRAIERVGLAYHELGDLRRAFPYLRRAHETAPAEAKVAVKLATIYLVGGRPTEARGLAADVLARDGANLDALQIVAGAARSADEVDGAVKSLEAARPALDDKSGYHLTRAELAMKKRDVAGAEAALRTAVERDPKGVNTRLALASFYVGQGQREAAEAALKQAVAIDPIKGKSRMRLADFYISTGRLDAARPLLDGIQDKSEDYLAAKRRLAEIAMTEGKLDESLAILDVVFKKAANDADAHLIRGRIFLSKGQLNDAIQSFQTVLRLEPKRVQARYLLAVAYRQANNVAQARSELAQAMETAPTFVDGALLLAELNLESGNATSAIEAMEKLVATQPKVAQAYVVLGTAYLSKRNLPKALETFRKMEAVAPKDPRAPYLAGVSLQALGKRAEAAREFERALAMAPRFIDALTALVGLALDERQPQVALERVKKQVALEPNSAAVRYMLGVIHHLRREKAEAEAAYLKALELEPGVMPAYLGLGRLYLDGKDDARALARFEQALTVKPDDIVARMLAAQMYLGRGDMAKAKAAYERILTVNPRFAPAANNLAWILSQEGTDKDRALRLAQVAKEVAPNDPYVSDTLGWILYQRGVYERAWNLLRDSATKLPDNPEVQYHAGMAARQLGQAEAARTFLKRAVAFAGDFPAKRDAQKALSELQ